LDEGFRPSEDFGANMGKSRRYGMIVLMVQEYQASAEDNDRPEIPGKLER